VNRLLSFCSNGRASELCRIYDAHSNGLVGANAFRSFFEKAVTQNTQVHRFRRNIASVLAAEGADMKVAQSFGISQSIFVQEQTRLQDSPSAPILGDIVRRTNSNSRTTKPEFVNEVHEFCLQYSAVNPSKQKNVLARARHGTLLKDSKGQRYLVQIRELFCKKADLFKLWKDAKKETEFSSVSSTSFFNAIPKWIREGRSTICTCVACDQMLGSLFLSSMIHIAAPEFSCFYF